MLIQIYDENRLLIDEVYPTKEQLVEFLVEIMGYNEDSTREMVYFYDDKDQDEQ